MVTAVVEGLKEEIELRRDLRITLLILILAALVPALVACDMIQRPGTEGNVIRIGSKNFTEQLILGYMYAQLLESNGMQVERQLNMDDTMAAHNALTSGKIDLYPEYTGTGLLAILNQRTMSDPEAVYDLVSRQYRERFKVVWLDQAPMNNSQALAVKRKFSEDNNLTTISQMVQMAPQLILAAVPDFLGRDDGLVALKRTYGAFNFEGIEIYEPADKYKGFLEGQSDVVLAFGTDGQIQGYDLVVLQDDKGAWPPYHVAPVVRQAALDRHPNLAKTLNQLAPLLTSEVMQDLNWRVDGPERAAPAKVSEDFLRQNGLVN